MVTLTVCELSWEWNAGVLEHAKDCKVLEQLECCGKLLCAVKRKIVERAAGETVSVTGRRANKCSTKHSNLTTGKKRRRRPFFMTYILYLDRMDGLGIRWKVYNKMAQSLESKSNNILHLVDVYTTDRQRKY